jgi:hypothetical protein
VEARRSRPIQSLPRVRSRRRRTNTLRRLLHEARVRTTNRHVPDLVRPPSTTSVHNLIHLSAIPVTSTPHGASHRLRFWLRTPFVSHSPASSATSQSESYIYQRIWKSDDFKVGAGLNFEALGSRLVMGVRDPDSPRIERDFPCLNPNRQRSARTPTNAIGSSR